jgi:urease accessory protein
MLINKKSGNIFSTEIGQRTPDPVRFEWFETKKRIQRKTSQSGDDVVIKFLQQSPDLSEGDILFIDEKRVIIVEIIACECLVISPRNIFETASVCYEIGNKHLPLFFESGNLLVPYEKPLHRLLEAQGYDTEVASRKLLHPLNTTVSPHGEPGSTSLFTRIMQLTTGDK